MTYQDIIYDVEDGILTLTPNRPDKLNAFTPTMLDELLDALDAAENGALADEVVDSTQAGMNGHGN